MSYPLRVLDKVRARFQPSKDGCWEWPASRTAAGYGQLGYREGGRQHLAYAHRAAYFISHGDIPKGMHICHHCDNPACFNPGHLFLGTAKENIQDMVRKGRGNRGKLLPIGDRHWTRARPDEIRGSANGRSKLSDDQVLEIYYSPEKGVRLAERFGVTATVISQIRHGKTWRHLTQGDQRARQRPPSSTAKDSSDPGAQ